ncbi:Dynamin family protein [Succiniclasticum ruminis]|uniref:Dynamin family protein n=1 Tax=Succiniclasticum ruminis TaxID=40841 RepID=A0A1G6KGV5_9FIRM|nr:dynamin family protein [Succiniclasticum ruminis]SDC30147.1 Dynamin family protein [Succiniclasticum ruminis]
MNLQKQLLGYLDEIRNIDDLNSIPEFRGDIARFTERLTDKEFRIAVVGEFSSGKSTFINAFLGKDILSHATTETTAVITRLINVVKDDKLAYTGLVKFRNGSQIELTDLKQIKDYTTTTSTKYKVIEDIESVNIFVPIVNDKTNVVIVDTPGLNGMADGHRDITVDIIKKAHACIYLLQERGLTETDTDFIRYLLNYQRNFIFIQNFIDKFNEIEGESAEKKVAEQENLLKEHVFDKHPDAQFSICGISALQKLVSADKEIARLYDSSTEDLTDTERLELNIKSNFSTFEKIVQDQFAEEKLTKLQYGDTAWAINHWLHELIEFIQRQQSQAQDALRESKEHGALERLERLKTIINEKQPKHEKYLADFIGEQIRDLRKKGETYIDNELAYLCEDIGKEIDACINISKLIEKGKSMSSELNRKLDVIYDKGKESISTRIIGLYHVISAQIVEYSGIKSEELKLKQITINIGRSNNAFELDKSRLENIKEELEEATEAEQKAIREVNQRKYEINKAKSDVNAFTWEYNDAKERMRNEIYELGNRPVVRTYQRAYTYYRDREGVLGWFAQRVVGRKKCTGYETVTDDSAGRAWDEEKRKIENKYNPKIIELDGKKNAAQRRLNRLKSEQSSDESCLIEAQANVKSLSDEVAKEKEIVRLRIENAEKEHLKNEKVKLKTSVKNYLNDTVAEQLKESMKQTLEKQTDYLTDWALKNYRTAVHQKLQWVEQCKLEKAPELQNRITSLNATLKRLAKVTADMEALK